MPSVSLLHQHTNRQGIPGILVGDVNGYATWRPEVQAQAEATDSDDDEPPPLEPEPHLDSDDENSSPSDNWVAHANGHIVHGQGPPSEGSDSDSDPGETPTVVAWAADPVSDARIADTSDDIIFFSPLDTPSSIDDFMIIIILHPQSVQDAATALDGLMAGFPVVSRADVRHSQWEGAPGSCMVVTLWSLGAARALLQVLTILKARGQGITAYRLTESIGG